MFYHVYVKRPTRKGGEVIVDRVVEFDGTNYDLRIIMSNNYQGLIVECVDIQKVEKIKKNHNLVIPAHHKEEKKHVTETRLKLNVQLNDEEKVVRANADKARREFTDAVSQLNNMFKKRKNNELSTFGHVTDVDVFRKPTDFSSPSFTLVLSYKIEEFKKIIEQ